MKSGVRALARFLLVLVLAAAPGLVMPSPSGAQPAYPVCDPVAGATGVYGYAQGGVVRRCTAYFTANRLWGDARGVLARSPEFPWAVAFDAVTFARRRTYGFADTYDSAPTVVTRPGGTTLVVAHEYRKHRTSAFYADTGKKAWTGPANQPGKSFFSHTYFRREDGRVLILGAFTNGLHAQDAADGTEVWHFPAHSSGGVTPCVVQETGRVYYQANGALFALVAETGRVLARVPVPPPNRSVSWNTVWADHEKGPFVVTYWYGRPYRDSAIRVYDDNLRPVWERTGLALSEKATITYVNGRVVVGCGNTWSDEYAGDDWKAVTCYDVTSGKVLWRCDLSRHDFVSILNVPYFNGYFYAETQDVGKTTCKLFRIRETDGACVQVLDYGRPMTSCAPHIIAAGHVFSPDCYGPHGNQIVVTRIAENTTSDWPGLFADPRTNTCAVPGTGHAVNVPMREVRVPFEGSP